MTTEPLGTLDITGVRAVAAGLVTAEHVILPVRHHSPACAFQVRRAIETYRPSVVLVEGPRSFTPLISELADPRASAPLAIYTYTDPARRTADAPRRGAYYPFCDFSPELVALRTAAAHEIPARFIDLDFGEQLAVEDARAQPVSLLDEHHLALSERIQQLAERLGCSGHDDLWEHLFEADATTVDLDEHLARMSAYCLLARADARPGELDRDGTTARESEMAWHIADAVDDRDRGGRPVLAVVGGFHAVVLPRMVAARRPRPTIRSVPGRSAVIRFGFDRVERVNGYAAGIPSPGWQQRVFDGLNTPEDPNTPGTQTGTPNPRAAAALEVLLDVAAQLERDGRPVSQPALTDAYGQLLGLAELRGHIAPLRSDILDGIASTFVQGDIEIEGPAILAAAHRVLTGDRLGVLPPGVTAPPLVADALDRLRRSRLAVDTPIPSEVTLGIYRSPAHRRTSRLLHGLGELEVPFGQLVSGPDFAGGTELHLITERWSCRWSPATEAALVEAGQYGDTLPDAVATHFDERLADFAAGHTAFDAATATGLLEQACQLGLHHQAKRCLVVAGQALRHDPSFVGVAQACAAIALLAHAREPLEAGHLVGLGSLLQTGIERSLFLGRTLPAESADSVVTALMTLREVISDAALVTDPDDVEGFWELVGCLRTDHPEARVRGGATGLCHGSGRLTIAQTIDAVTGSLSGTLAPSHAIDFLHGLLSTARELAWQTPELVDAIGALLATWPAEDFVEFLPGLRLAFAELTPSEIDRVAVVVGTRLGLSGSGAVIMARSTADESTITAHLALSVRARELLAEDGLADWTATP